MAFASGTLEILIMIVVPISIIFVIREIVCWYSKINLRIELMKEQNTLLKSVIKEMGKTSLSIQELSKTVDDVKSKLSEALKPVVIVPVKPEPTPIVEPVASDEIDEEEDIENLEEEEEESIEEQKETYPYGTKLSDKELMRVEELIKQDMAPGEQVVIHKWTRQVAVFGVENWKCTNPTEWFILFEKPE
ncbi:MAG: hypothetical protein PHX49_10555 [Bacteroidales bacterium]|jgi:hypothetical protein|nr:hypothetical protein [Bacteroidales bacterium]